MTHVTTDCCMQAAYAMHEGSGIQYCCQYHVQYMARDFFVNCWLHDNGGYTGRVQQLTVSIRELNTISGKELRRGMCCARSIIVEL